MSRLLTNVCCLLCMALLAPGVGAAVIALPTASPISVPGVGTLTVTPTPALLVQATGADYTNFFAAEGSALGVQSVGAGIAALFNIPASTLLNSGGDLNPTAPFSVSDRFGFNFLTLNNGDNELVLYYPSLIYNLSAAGDPFLQVSTYFIYNGPALAAPEASSAVILGGAIGLLLAARAAGVRRRRARHSA